MIKKEMIPGMLELAKHEDRIRTVKAAEQIIDAVKKPKQLGLRPTVVCEAIAEMTKFPALNARVNLDEIATVSKIQTTVANPYESSK